MTASRQADPYFSDGEGSVLALAVVLLRWRKWIIGLMGIGAMLGLLAGLLSRRVYVAEAVFLPQNAEPNLSGLALAASQFGLRLPTSTGGSWGPPVYVELLQSRALLAPIASDTVTVAEEEGRRVALLDLFMVAADPAAQQIDRGVVALRRVSRSQEVKALGAVRVRVTTRWPSVSLAIAERLVDGVQRFNLEARQSQAGAERRFVDTRVEEAERTLRQAEDRLQQFLQRNRAITGSPELAFERDRLQREVNLRQQLYTALLQSREEARVREVRDTPVITMLEAPRLPVLPASRRTGLKVALGILGGGLAGVTLALLIEGLARARRTGGEAAQFFQAVDKAIPGFLRRLAS